PFKGEGTGRGRKQHVSMCEDPAVATFASDGVASPSREENSTPNQNYSGERPRSHGADQLIGFRGCDRLFKAEFNATLMGRLFAAGWDSSPLPRDFVSRKMQIDPLVQLRLDSVSSLSRLYLVHNSNPSTKK